MYNLDRFQGLKALVVGDVMVDSYTKGVVERMSPEAPVPIVNPKERFDRLGGAANVALNLKALGATAIVCAVVGDDTYGHRMIQMMQEHDLDTQGMVMSTSRITTVKHRIFDQDRQLLRIDEEDCFDLNEEERHALEENIKALIKKNPFDVIILQDYNKGVLSLPMIQCVLKLANSNDIPVAVDPKKRNFFAYHGVTLFKPNAKELRDGLGVNAETVDELQQAARRLQGQLKCRYLMVTLSEQGVMILHDGTFHHLPAYPRNIVDVSGAGDTVLSIAALSTALREDALTIAMLSNIAGGLVCEEAGVVPVDRQRLSEEIKRLRHD